MLHYHIMLLSLQGGLCDLLCVKIDPNQPKTSRKSVEQ